MYNQTCLQISIDFFQMRITIVSILIASSITKRLAKIRLSTLRIYSAYTLNDTNGLKQSWEVGSRQKILFVRSTVLKTRPNVISLVNLKGFLFLCDILDHD